jgi:hypothetical protein
VFTRVNAENVPDSQIAKSLIQSALTVGKPETLPVYLQHPIWG